MGDITKVLFSFLMWILAFKAAGQTIVIEDPDITFCFDKPTNWTMEDDGLVINLYAPQSHPADNIDVISFTYFQPANGSLMGFNTMDFSTDTTLLSFTLTNTEPLKVADKTTSIKTFHDIGHAESVIFTCYFEKFHQFFQCEMKTFHGQSKKKKRIFRRFLKSLSIKKS